MFGSPDIGAGKGMEWVRNRNPMASVLELVYMLVFTIPDGSAEQPEEPQEK